MEGFIIGTNSLIYFHLCYTLVSNFIFVFSMFLFYHWPIKILNILCNIFSYILEIDLTIKNDNHIQDIIRHVIQLWQFVQINMYAQVVYILLFDVVIHHSMFVSHYA